MKSLYILIVIIICSISANAQTKTMEIDNKLVEYTDIKPMKYDSLENHKGADDVGMFIGQVLFLKGTEDNEKYSYIRGFSRYPNHIFDGSNKDIYKPLDNGHTSNFNLIGNKKYYVSRVLSFNNSDSKNIYFELICENGDTVYYDYSNDTWQDFDEKFIVNGYYEKMKKKLVGRNFILTDNPYYIDKYYSGIRSIDTREEIKDIPEGSLWKCIDVGMDKNNLRKLIAILENKNLGIGYALTSDFYSLNGSLSKFIDKEYSDLQKRKEIKKRQLILKKYGKINADLIRRNFVKIGWTEDMCVYSWGKPSDINRTITKYGINEQWVYDDNRYLYFENGKLTSIQD